MINLRRNQKGMASIVIVSVLVIILTLVSIAFSRLMDRAVNNSTNKELAAAATYAAESGVNDASNYIDGHYTPASAANNYGLGASVNSNCKSLLDTGGGPIVSKLSNNGPVQYNCLTISPEVSDVVFGGQTPLPAYKSQIVKLTTDSSGGFGPTDRLLISWVSGDGNNTTVPSGSTSLPAEASWGSNGYSPMLRLSLYAVNSSGNIPNTNSPTRTYFFYPSTGSSGSNITSFNSNNEALQPASCGNTGLNAVNPKFNPGNDSVTDGSYTCSVIISGLSGAIGSGGYYYARLTPEYDSANIRVIANDKNGNLLKFTGVQGVIDSTAKANTAIKRLQARVDLCGVNALVNPCQGPNDNSPEYVHNSPYALCKQLDVNSVTVLNVAPNTCNLTITQPPPTVDMCVQLAGTACDPTTNAPSSVTITTGQSADTHYLTKNVTNCNLSPGGPSGFGDVGDTLWNTGVFNNAGTYTYILTCDDISGSNPVSKSITVIVEAPLPNPNPNPNPGPGPGPGPSGAIYVNPLVCADNSGPECSWYNNGGVGPTDGSEQCHDGQHSFIICLSWKAQDTWPGAYLVYCQASGYGSSSDFYEENGADRGDHVPSSGYEGTNQSAPRDNWWNVTLGWYGGQQPQGNIVVTITCYDNQGHSGNGPNPPDPICTSFYSTCENGGNNNPPPPPPPPPPPEPCVKWSTGYQPSCTCLYPPPGSVSGDGSACPGPPSGGGGGCGINIGRDPFLPDYGLMFLEPSFGVIPCP